MATKFSTLARLAAGPVGTNIADNVQADHAVPAFSGPSLACVVWSSKASNKEVKAAIYRVSPSGLRLLQEFTLATAGTSIYAGGETNEHPWVCGLADGGFAVCWVRHNLGLSGLGTHAAPDGTGAATSQIEVARLTKTPNGFTVDSASAGAGHVLDATVTRGSSDVTPRIVSVKGDLFALAYTHETNYDVTGANNSRDFAVRLKYLDWSAAGSPTITMTGSSPVAFDDDDTNPFVEASAGCVLPHLAVDRHYNVILALEESDDSQASGNKMRIGVSRLAGPYHATPGSFIGVTASIYNAANKPFRRPMLSSLHPQDYHAADENACYVAFSEQGVINENETNARLWKITFDTGAAPVQAEVTIPANDNEDAGLEKNAKGACVMTDKLIAVENTANFQGAEGRSSQIVHSDGTEEWWTSPQVFWPSRPAFASVRLNKETTTLILKTYEGSDSGSNADDRIYLVAYSLA